MKPIYVVETVQKQNKHIGKDYKYLRRIFNEAYQTGYYRTQRQSIFEISDKV
jgi:hypothetical protein